MGKDTANLWLEIGRQLQEGGWTGLVYRSPSDTPSPRPSFFAVSPRDPNERVQIHIKKLDRGGRVGANAVKYIVEQSQHRTPEWPCWIVSDRGFTENAAEYAYWVGDWVKLMSPAECLALLRSFVECAAPLHGNVVQVRADILISNAVSPELLRQLASSRNTLEQTVSTVGARFMEELVAENWRAEGYEVKLVPRVNAPGPDVIATRTDSVVPIKILTSCKWRGSKTAIKISEVAELLAWVDTIHPANAGVLATNTSFQSGARELLHRYHRVHGLDGRDLLAWTMKLWQKT